MKRIKNYLVSFFKDNKKWIPIVITLIISLGLIVLELSLIPPVVWVVILIMGYFICDHFTNSPRCISGSQNTDGGDICYREIYYREIAGHLLTVLKGIAKDFEMNVSTIESIFLPDQKRYFVSSDGCYYNYSCLLSSINSNDTLLQLRDYLNKELKNMQTFGEALVVAVRITQKDNRLYITATTVCSPDDEARLYMKMRGG